jgi:hypothetical protein
MKRYIKIPVIAIIVAGLYTSCEKKIDPIDESFTVEVAFNNSGAKYVTSDIEVNPKDSLFFDFTVTSKDDLDVVEIQKNGTRVDTFKVPASGKNAFSAVKKYMADSIPGDYSYRILAKNKKGIFIGDGGKLIKVTVKPDFYFWTYRFVYVPDTVAKTNKTYFATATGQVYSYSEGAGNSASIDFGYYFDTTSANKHTIYALTAPQPQLDFYDISSWTKRATIFKKATSPAFNNLTSGGALQAAGKTNLSSGTSLKVTALAAGNLVYFKTVEGKIGCIQISFINGISPSKTTCINIDVKVQR